MKKKSPQIGIVLSTFNEKMVRRMQKACCETLAAHGIHSVEIHTVPGAFEIPLRALQLAQSKRFDALAVFGVVIQGDTMHFELIAAECARGIMDVMLQFKLPIVFEVLAVYNEQQAMKRTTGKNNKGYEAANALLSLLEYTS